MNKRIVSQGFDVTCKVIAAVALGYVCFKVLRSELPVPWGSTQYDYDLGLSSPDGLYTLTVIRGDKSAIDDFLYHVYVFPKNIAPEGISKGQPVKMAGIWRDKRYLVYAGYAIPSLRWTSNHEIEIDLDDLYDEVDEFHPVPNLDDPKKDNSSAILVSLILNKQDSRNIMP